MKIDVDLKQIMDMAKAAMRFLGTDVVPMNPFSDYWQRGYREGKRDGIKQVLHYLEDSSID